MEKLESLKLTDKMEIDTSMATEYINKLNEDIYWPYDCFYYESEPGRIEKTTYIEELFPYLKLPKIQDAKNAIYKLAKKIEENTEMFVQLEYLARGTDPRDVREGHVKLMSQLLRCDPAVWNGFCNTLYFNGSTHLYNLVFVVGNLYNCRHRKPLSIIIIDDIKFVALCKFFTDLCHEVGMEHIHLVRASTSYAEHMMSTEHEYRKYRKAYNESAENTGCTGVVAERADLDSAIDCFINSSVTAPWRLKYIYIQESIFDDFKDALKAKCDATDVSGDVTIGDKTFLIERQDGQGIPTNAFRTTKDLLSMIETPYLSIWAAETALSHEIALRSSSSTIWINDFGSFFGPPRSALSVFNLSIEASLPCNEDIQTMLSKWSKLKTEERYDVIAEALSGLPDFVPNDSLLEITDKTICFGVPQHLGLINCNITDFDEQKWLRMLKILLDGNGIVYNEAPDDKISKLQKFGVPIACPFYQDSLFKKSSRLFVSLSIPVFLERLKVVRTNYGTIFAN